MLYNLGLAHFAWPKLVKTPIKLQEGKAEASTWRTLIAPMMTKGQGVRDDVVPSWQLFLYLLDTHQVVLLYSDWKAPETS
jgi:hypothetical protein